MLQGIQRVEHREFTKSEMLQRTERMEPIVASGGA